VLACLALSFTFGCKSGKPTQATTAAGQEAVSSAPKINPDEYHEVDADKVGFKILAQVTREIEDSDGNFQEGTIKKLAIDDNPSPLAQGNSYPIKLASNEMTGAAIQTADFGVIRFKVRPDSSWSMMMTDNQIKKVQDFIKTKKK
jgi:hypothetical protein